MSTILTTIHDQVITCCRCPRLVAWRESVAVAPPRRYAGQTYWARPIPSWGDPQARLVIVGLAPAAHGGNRTGRVFTGDRSGDWLFRALHKASFANQPNSTHIDDGLELTNCFICAAGHCAPPDNKPLPAELLNCRPYLLAELDYFFGASSSSAPGILLGLGKIGFDAAFDAIKALGLTAQRTRPRFGHGVEVQLNDTLTLMGTYHPSQQNTFTGKLTEPMFDSIFSRAREIVEGGL